MKYNRSIKQNTRSLLYFKTVYSFLFFLLTGANLLSCVPITDVDSGTETKFNVRASTEFVGATQALVSLTPTKSGAAAFLAVADTETIPSATAAEALLAYREIDFSGTSAQIIQFALSISATQDTTNGEVSGTTTAVLQPSTAYKIVMYSNGNSTTLLSFTTLGSINEGYTHGNTYTFDVSEHNFRTEADGKFTVPFVFSWVTTSSINADIENLYENGGRKDTMAAFNQSSYMHNTFVNVFGNSNQGGAFLHTPRSIDIQSYKIYWATSGGSNLTIIYN
ncbi:hypothetical protein P0082_08570 [Candidatus Haliotispira prima]|uniref:Lipoprotein n=1 Tax=Candidatus Haliotispira prima TaxID=3034016 RepID=A0ABY8MG68_9SPIO|nr:hypothetical protein P0082_08570 [Candidatus Haliotispira prima]